MYPDCQHIWCQRRMLRASSQSSMLNGSSSYNGSIKDTVNMTMKEKLSTCVRLDTNPKKMLANHSICAWQIKHLHCQTTNDLDGLALTIGRGLFSVDVPVVFDVEGN